MDRNNEKPSCERGARNASKLAQKDPPASIGAEEDTHNLNLYAGITLEAILEPSNLKEALKRVVANRGAPGIDGMEVGQLLDWIRNHPGQLTKTVLCNKQQPKYSTGPTTGTSHIEASGSDGTCVLTMLSES